MAIYKFRHSLGQLLSVGKGNINYRGLVMVIIVFGLLSSEYSIGLISALLRSRHFTETTVVAAEGTQLYKYEAETLLSLDSAAQFNTQTYTQNNFESGKADLRAYTAADDYLGLNYYGNNPPNTTIADWWDSDNNSATQYLWKYRKCFQIDFSAGVQTQTNYQIYIDVDTATPISQGKMLATGADIRFIDKSSNILDHYIADDINDASTRIWVQLKGIVAGSTEYVCMYYGNPSATNISSATTAFDYPTPTELYYVVQDTVGAGSIADFVSYANNNSIEFEGYNNTLGQYQFATHSGGTISYQQTTPISVTKPIAGAFANNGTEALVPASNASTAFTYRLDTGTNEFSFLSPWCSANIQVRNGNNNIVTSGSFTLAAGTATDLTTTNNTSSGIPNNGVVMIEVTNGCPILVTHHTTNAQHAFPMFPASTEWYGVGSQNLEISALTNGTTVTIYRSDGNTNVVNLNRGGQFAENPPGPSGEGSEYSYRVVSNLPIGVLARDDSDGNESVTFMPVQEMNYRYYIPQNAQYIAIATRAGISTTVGYHTNTDTCGDGTPNGGTSTVSPSGNFPGKVYFGSTSDGTNINAGGCVVSNQPIYAYYEKSATNGETSVWGRKQSRQFISPEPTVNVGAAEAGSWNLGTGDTWNVRRPITFTNNSTSDLSDYQLRVDINSLADIYSLSQSNGGDLRLAGNMGDGTDNNTYWLESYNQGGQTAEFWAKFPLVSGSSSTTLYLYYDSTSGTSTTTGSEVDLFSFSERKDVYYVVDSDAASSSLNVISYDSGNSVNDTGDTYPLNMGQLLTIPQTSSLDQTDSVSSTGPLHVGFNPNTSDSAAPISYAGTEFVNYAPRNTDVFSVYSPFGNASVQIQQSNGATFTTLSTTPVNMGAAATISTNITNGRAMRILSNVPILAFHRAGTSDSFVMYPTRLGYEIDSGSYELYGVGSNNMGVAAVNNNTSVTIYRSNGTSSTVTLNAGNNLTYTESGGGSQGDSMAYHIVANGPIGALAWDDSDGTEATTFVSQKEFYTTYTLSSPSQYFAVVTKDPSVTCNVFNASGVAVGFSPGMDNVPPETSGALSLPYPNRIHIGGNDTSDGAFFSAGFRMICDQPVFAYFEYHSGGISDETNWLTYPQGRKYTYPAPNVSNINSSNEEGLYYESGFDSAGPATEFQAYMQIQIDGGNNHTSWKDINWTQSISSRTQENGVTPLNTMIAYGDGTDCNTASYSAFTLITSGSYIPDNYSDHRCLRTRFFLRTGDEAYTPRLLSVELGYYTATLLADQSSMPQISIAGNFAGTDERRRILKAVTTDAELGGSDAFLTYNSGSNTAAFTNADLQFLQITPQTINPQFDFPPFPGSMTDAGTTSGFDAGNSIAVYFVHRRVAGATSQLNLSFKADIENSGGPLLYRDFLINVSGI